MATVETATNDLIHALGNFLGVVQNASARNSEGVAFFADSAALGAYVLDKAPVLRASLDKLRGALSRNKIEAEEHTHHVWTNNHTGETIVLYEGGMSLPARKYPWLQEFSGDFKETALFCTGWRAGWLAREVSNK